MFKYVKIILLRILNKIIKIKGVLLHSEWVVYFFLLFLSVIPAWPSLVYLIPQSDLAYIIPQIGGHITVVPDSWTNLNFGGNNTTGLWNIIPINVTYRLLSILGPNLSQFLMFTSTVFIGMVGMYVLLRSSIFRLSQFPSFLGAIFFMFNTYTLVYFPGSFFQTMVQAALPFQFLFFTLALTRDKKYVFLAVGATVLVCGVNLIFDVIAFALIVSYGLFRVFVIRDIRLTRLGSVLGIFFGTLVLLTAWWTVPYFVSNLSDGATTSSVLASETFYNNDSSPLNVVRFLGEWGFFVSQDGIPYNWFAKSYNTNPIVLFSTFLLPILIVGSALAVIESATRKKKAFVLYLFLIFVLLLAFIGGKHSGWPTTQLFVWSFVHVPYFSAFRDTQKWLSLGVFVGSILLAFGAALAEGISKKKTKRLNIAGLFGVIALVLVLISAYPMTLGTWFDASSELTAIPDYWFQMASTLNTLSATSTRVLLTPNQYFDTYVWNGTRVGIPGNLTETLSTVPVVSNTCIGCGNPDTLALLTYIYQTLDNKNLPSFLGMLGISDILQRNDYASAYYQTETPGQMSEILSGQGLATSTSYGALDLYPLPANVIAPRVFVPNQLLLVDSFQEMRDRMSYVDASSTAFLLTQDIPTLGTTLNALQIQQIRTLFRPDTVEMNGENADDTVYIAKGGEYSLENTPGHLEPVSLNAKVEGNTLVVQSVPDRAAVYVDGSRVISNSTSSGRVSIPLSLTHGAIGVLVGTSTSAYLVNTANDAWQYLTDIPINQTIALQTVQVEYTGENLIPNGDLSDGLWSKTAGNCSGGSPDTVSINTQYDPHIQKPTLVLSSTGGRACTFSPSALHFDPNALYHVQFQYKHDSGGPASFCVWDGQQCLLSQTLDNNVSTWQTIEAYVRPDKDSGQIVIFFYSDTGNFLAAQNEFADLIVQNDGLKISNVLYLKQQQVTNITPSLALSAGSHEFSASLNIDDQNLVQNGSFEDGSWTQTVGNCRNQVDNNEQYMSIVQSNGHSALNLSAGSDIACTSANVTGNLSPDSDYVLDFDYSLIQGNGSICVYDGTSCLAQTELSTTTPSTWRHGTLIFRPQYANRSVSIYLYADATQDTWSNVLFDNIAVYKSFTPIIRSYFLSPSQPLTYNHSNVSYVLQSDTERSGTITISNDMPFPLVFLETYHPDWQLTVDGQVVETHFVVDGFANAWVIDPKELGLKLNSTVSYELTYTPQHWFYLGILISGTTLLACLGYLSYEVVRRMRRKDHA